MNEKTIKTVYLEITSREDEKKWKEFLKHYFPNHYASRILKQDLVVEDVNKQHRVKRIGVSPDGYGWLSAMCICFGRPGRYIPVKDFDEFQTTEVYLSIIKQGVKLDEGEPSVISIKVDLK